METARWLIWNRPNSVAWRYIKRNVQQQNRKLLLSTFRNGAVARLGLPTTNIREQLLDETEV